MASNKDEGSVLDTAMEQDEEMAQPKVNEAKPTYKSFKCVLFTMERKSLRSIPFCANRPFITYAQSSNSANI
jgi:hypothetical protein